MNKTNQIQKNQNLSPNLLRTSPPENPVEKYCRTIVAALKILIIITQIVFVVTLILNATFSAKISKLQVEVKALEMKLINKDNAAQAIKNVISRTDLLKTLETRRFEMADGARKVISNTPVNVSITSATLEGTKVDLVIETNSAIEVASLMNTYLNKNVTNEITLKSARLNTSSGKFITGIEIITI